MTLEDAFHSSIALWRVGEQGAQEANQFLRREIEKEAVVEEEHEIRLQRNHRVSRDSRSKVRK
jgi:hypothetical protein